MMSHGLSSSSCRFEVRHPALSEDKPGAYDYAHSARTLAFEPESGGKNLLRSSSNSRTFSGSSLFSLVRGAYNGVLIMSGSNGLTCSVSDIGIFIHFTASDGSETQVDALTVLEGSTALTNEPLFSWCHERLEEATPCEVSEERRWDLLAAIDEVAAAKKREFSQAEAAGAHLEVGIGGIGDPGEWLKRAEQALNASAVLLTKEAFRALLILAKKGASLPGSSRSVTANAPSQAWDCCG